jgi:hypothetical protein
MVKKTSIPPDLLTGACPSGNKKKDTKQSLIEDEHLEDDPRNQLLAGCEHSPV